MVELIKVFLKQFRTQLSVIMALVCVFYIVKLIEATKQPWTLWRQAQREQSRIASYETEKACEEQQWPKLRQELEAKQEVDALLAKEHPGLREFRSVFIQEGRTIFEVKKSTLFHVLNERTNVPPDMQTEIVDSVSFFCVRTSAYYGLWPFYTPSYNAALDALVLLAEKQLKIRAKQLLEQ